jgi:hypothetical protein
MSDIKEKIEQRLQKQQSSKEFKDIGRVAQTRKEKSAYKLISGQLLNTLEEDAVMAYNMVKKENVWPEINVQEERERGTTSGATYLKVKLRESVPTRPKDEKSKRATYVFFLEFLQKDLLECFTVEQIYALVQRYKAFPMDKIIGYFINPEFLTADEQTKNKITEKLKENSNIRMALLYGSSSLVKKLIEEIFGARFTNSFFKYSEAASVAWYEAEQKEPITPEQSAEMIEKLSESKANFISANEKLKEDYKNKTREQLLKSMDTDWRIGPENKKIYKQNIELFREWVISYYDRRVRNEMQVFEKKEKLFQPKDNDWSWIEKEEKSGEVSKPKAIAINTKAPLSYIKRTGGYKIETNTPAEIVDKFGFSAVNYGVYVDDVWSKEHTKHFLGAMSDMASILNINIKQLNELGKLSIAFGAKGRKGHAAAYFPQTKDINLTRGNGDGSVAHEYGHYFDNVIVELEEKKAENKFASEGVMPDIEIRTLFKELMDFYYKGNPLYTPLIPMTFYAKESESAPSFSLMEGGRWENKTIEIKETIEETLDQLKSFAVVDQSRYNTQLRLFGYVIHSFGLSSYQIPMQLRTSYVYHKSAYSAFTYCYPTGENSIILGANPRTKYWISAVELFARAWETVILKKILDIGRVSNYLVNDIPMEDIVSENYFAPYPAGKELDYLETIINKIIIAVKKRFSIGDYVPPSSTIEDDYIELNKKGEEKEGIVVEDKKIVQAIESDKTEAISTLEMLVKTGGTEQEINEWNQTINTLKK